MFKKLLVTLLIIGSITPISNASEGMWIPLLINKNMAEMQKMGLKITADDIYNINKSSLKDAIVQLVKTETGAGFCTGELISAEGLMLTNHHCGYDAIQKNSSVQNDYLTNGFWAKTKGEELQAPGMSASMLVRIEDVSAKVLTELAKLGTAERAAKLKEIETKLTEEATKGTTYSASLKEMFYGNQYFLYVYERFNDVRMVGAPPSSIGKFGGDTDNWMWPRHTGDFALFRVYMSPEGKPAAYSKNNVPYKSKHFLPISLKGVNENDFSMIVGYPGRTNRYASSFELQNAISITNPALIKIFGKKLETMKTDMDRSDEIRIKLASKYASMSNTHKYYIGQNRGLERLKVIDQKKAEETEFNKWVAANPERKAKYAAIFPRVDSTYNANRTNNLISLYCQLAAQGSDLATYANTYTSLNTAIQKNDTAGINSSVKSLKKGLDPFYKDLSISTDKKVLTNLILLTYQNLPQAQQMPVFKEIVGSNSNPEQAIASYVESIYSQSMFSDKEKVKRYLDIPTTLDKDPLLTYVTKLNADFRNLVPAQIMSSATSIISKEKRSYIAGLMEMKPEKNFSPDANSSTRLTYGKIASYEPMDGVHYSHYTTTDGILEKENPKDEEFIVPSKLIELIRKKDFGRYKDKDGSMRVAFIGTTDITGGNSGSPVINGKGELVGTAFDGNWEAMTGDLVFDPKYKRTISVDIRYVLFIIEKFAGADNLIKEMKLVE